LPLLNMGEPAVLFCFAFLYIAARGPGTVSLDAMMRGGSKRRERLNATLQGWLPPSRAVGRPG
jgi:hypothetical protein